ncbi:phospholipase D-like domain-containing protein [Methylocella tundrae]|uniref:phospholipase D n=1 Tax=Methylocella tundrae TaxID=227605 RepID=A0A4U8YVN4_METTU|nr:phospholipase D-like domain-containing protein [Methylocella tundrae]WPP05461.1 phospholipase D-like domain-containing protein [Methylocella tundrae]VFU07881.1 Phosphatidylserine synthase [Methylocella tundrae]
MTSRKFVAILLVGTVLDAALFRGVPALWQAKADPAPIVHYAPAENLERIDVALINEAKVSIDMAAYVLSDVAVIEALTRAADRGVALRIYLYEDQIRDYGKPYEALQDLKITPGVEIRVKSASTPLMHLKSYTVDGRVLRSGAANFSASGLKRQDNDLIILESAEAAAAFKRNFEVIWANGGGHG